MAMFRSFVRMFGIIITTGHPPTGVLGYLVAIVLTDCGVEVLGTTSSGIVAAPFVAGTVRVPGTTSGVFV